MAEGGAAEGMDPACMEENLQAQQDEIEVLRSIFAGEEDRIQVLSEASTNTAEQVGQNMLQLYVPMACPDTVHVDVLQPAGGAERERNGLTSEVQIARSESGRRVIWSFEAQYLPPLVIYATLPRFYPSQDPPSYAVSCTWMSPTQLTIICQQLDRLWQETSEAGVGMPILYTWVDWLQENAISTLGVTDHISLSSHEVDEDVDDCRVITESGDLNHIVSAMSRYNNEEDMRVFLKTDHECEICFQEDIGSKFFRLSECKHHMCRECLTSHCELLVKEGTVQNLKCPMYECKTLIQPYILQEALKPEDFERYDKLSLQKALGSMSDISWCPRCNNVVIVEPEAHLKLGHCTVCMYSFCTQCMEKWHQGEKCSTELDDEEDEDNSKKSDAKQESLRKRRQQAKRDNRASARYIDDFAKRCPKCNSPVMKTAGCNKVNCGYCHANMCWICMREIRGYDHFTDNPKCSTFSFNQEPVDNTDLTEAYRNRYGVQPPPRPRFPQREAIENRGTEIKAHLADHPEDRVNVRNCVSCKQINMTANRSNHMRCWNCKVKFCYHCQKKIVGPIGKHFSGVGMCPQHRDT